MRVFFVLLLAGAVAANLECAETKYGNNGKQEKVIKTFYDFATVEKCQEFCNGNIDGCDNYKYCTPGKQCTEHYTRGGPDMKPGECRIGLGKFLPADNDGSYEGVVYGTGCKQVASPPPPPPAGSVQYSPTVFKNLAGDNIASFYNANLGSCMDECKKNTACRGFNICHQKECAGGTPENRCDLKTFSGEPSYYPDQTATSGDGYMSQYVISRN